MSKERPTNIVASVRARLLAVAKHNGEEFEQLLTRYCLERFLYRLGISAYVNQFVLKGAMLFVAWEGRVRRPTRDLDLLGFGEMTAEHLAAVVAAICAVPCPEDGIVLLAESIRVSAIREDQEYGGQRVVVPARLGAARLRCQIDVGVGDAITPRPVEQDFPALLPNMPRSRLRMYPRETVVAEKLEAMVQLGIANSRMKDFFDLWNLAGTFDFDGAILVSAVSATFARRNTQVPSGEPVALSDEMLKDRTKLAQWTAFLRAARFSEPTWPGAVSTLRPFLLPLLQAVRGERTLGRWPPGGPWAGAP